MAIALKEEAPTEPAALLVVSINRMLLTERKTQFWLNTQEEYRVYNNGRKQ
jgi:hypothetical protein